MRGEGGERRKRERGCGDKRKINEKELEKKKEYSYKLEYCENVQIIKSSHFL